MTNMPYRRMLDPYGRYQFLQQANLFQSLHRSQMYEHIHNSLLRQFYKQAERKQDYMSSQMPERATQSHDYTHLFSEASKKFATLVKYQYEHQRILQPHLLDSPQEL